MSTRFYGSICVSDLVDLAHKKHSAFSKGDNSKVYANITVWLNDEPDKFGNVISIQLNPKKELKELDGNPYIGNCKKAEPKEITDRDAGKISLPDDLPTKQPPINNIPEPGEIKEPISDLPF